MTDPTSLPNFMPPAAEQHPLRDAVVAALQEDGLLAEVDADGDVAYKVQGHQLFARCLEGEIPMMRVFGQWAIEEDLDVNELKALQASNVINAQTLFVKTSVAQNMLSSAVDNLVVPGADLKTLLPMSTNFVIQAVGAWHQIVTGQVPEDGSAPEGSQPQA